MHSLHAYFLVAGDVNAPIVYEVERRARRQELQQPPRRRDPAWPADLQHDGVVPSARRRARACGADAAGAGPRRLGRRARAAARRARESAREDAAVLDARAAVRVSARRADSRHRAAARGAGRATSGSRPSTSCPTTPTCTATCSRTSRTISSSRRRRCRTASISPRATCSSRASITRCGSIGRFAPTSGCSTRWKARMRRAAAGSRLGRFFTRDGALVASTAQEGVVRVWAGR